MRLPVNQAWPLGLVIVLAACGGSHAERGKLSSVAPAPARSGPSADYPVVIGKPFTVDGVTYTPEDRLNYDQVGYAGIGAGEGVSIAHRTLPLPSYAEVTSLETGRTILVRVTRRGPMTGALLVELSPAAATQLGDKGGRTPVRIRRVNPPEQERAALRSGGEAPARMDTPMSLVGVLRRKLDPSLGSIQPAIPATRPAPAMPPPAPATQPAIAPKTAPQPAAPAPAVRPAPAPRGQFVVQIGAFSASERGKQVARAVGGYVMPSGKLYRVRMGPFTSRGEAEAALAKARAAGYSEARIQSAD